MDAATWYILAGTGGACLVGAVAIGLSLRRQLSFSRRHVQCPRSGEEVQVIAGRDPKTGRWVRVAQCAARETGSCAEDCLDDSD